MTLRQKQRIELKHIQLELKNERTHHLRHFIDRYFCYSNSKYLTKNGTPKWEAITWKEYVSYHAKKTEDRSKVIRDHVVPLKIIGNKLRELGTKPKLKEIEVVINENLFFMTITKEEDKVLTNKGLRSRMPDKYEDEKHSYFGDPFARYREAGIQFPKVSI